MTHTLHREGIRKDSKDYVFLAMVEGNDPQKLDNLAELFKIILKHKPINYTGKALFPNLTDEQLPQLYKRTKIGMAVFDRRDALLEALKEIKDRELGVSVVVSGLFSQIGEDCGKLGLPMHTVNYSLGVWGNREKLPVPKITEITTMCGHGLISFNLVQSLVKEIRRGKKSLEEAANILARPCVCGVVNPSRARDLLQAMV
ncbi:MAG: hypothetical protein H6Q44_537 [Deltaproteobacteria bacterium]|nr:hypothetical protein [Deltaproteobacteria bacterium]